MRRLALAAVVSLACGSETPPALSTGPGVTSVTSSSTNSGGGSSSSTSSSTSSGGVEDSSASSQGSSSSTPLDMGPLPDFGPGQPEGCKGKIDFLFVISSGLWVEDIQEQLVDAFPKFIDTIQSKFADFDYHIMVTDGTGGWWGHTLCNKACPMTPEPHCVGYACDQLDLVGPCETTWGAGIVFNAGYGTMNKPCGVAGGRRYLTREQPELEETFECVARVGGTGGDLLGHMLVNAVSPELNGPGGCNEGFLRDDALLVVTLATASPDDNSPGTPPEWAQAVIAAKHDDPNAIVAFGITNEKYKGKCDPMDRICQVVEQFPYSHWISENEPDYGLGFDAATELVAEACGAYIPQ